LSDVLRVSLLLDFYGNLLTEKQRDMLRLHHEDDLSLGEIAEQAGVTRAAVHDALKRALVQLENYEARLGLIDRFRQQSDKIEEMRALLERALRLAEELKLQV